MNDSPNGLFQWESILEVDRKTNFELMLVAIEENSGRWINLTKLEWGQKVQLQVDRKMPINSRLRLKQHKTWCTHNGGKSIQNKLLKG